MRRMSQLFIHSPFVGLFDLVIIHLGFIGTFLLRWGNAGIATPNMRAYAHVAPYISVASLAIFYAGDLYTKWVRRRKRDIVFSVAIAAILIAAVSMAIFYWEQELWLARAVVPLAALGHFLLLMLYRLQLQSWYLSGPGRRRVMVVAEDDETAVGILRKLEANAPNWFTFSGYVLATDIDDLHERDLDFDTVLLTPRLPEEASIIKQCGRWRKHVMVLPAVLELSVFGARPLEIDDVLILSIHSPNLTPGRRFVKRLVDVCASASLLVLTSPIVAMTALVIKLTSKGPVIFKQDRVGQDGVEYTLYKFRTMVADAEKRTGPVLASKSDPRITRLGRWLRATRIDELPQLVNVLKGEMSIVGPRPERAFFVDQFRKTVPGYDLRFSVKPGITGLAQVAGGYSTTVERKLRFDLMYIFDYSLLLDAQILLRTILVMLDRKQAEGIRKHAPSLPVTQNENL